jgi:hypothetical protein
VWNAAKNIQRKKQIQQLKKIPETKNISKNFISLRANTTTRTTK